MSEPTARPRFEGSVHGVVVHTRKNVFGSPSTGSFRVIDGSCTSSYAEFASKFESGVAQRGQ